MATSKKEICLEDYEHLIPAPPYDIRPSIEHPSPNHLKWWSDRVWLRDNGSCIVCGVFAEFARIEVHHTTYERFGQESIEDGCLVCDRCHLAITQETRRRRDAGS